MNVSKLMIFYLQSKAIANAACFATLQHPLYNEKANKLLLFMLMRAQKPVQMKAGGFIYLSMESFGNVSKNPLVKIQKTLCNNLFT